MNETIRLTMASSAFVLVFLTVNPSMTNQERVGCAFVLAILAHAFRPDKKEK